MTVTKGLTIVPKTSSMLPGAGSVTGVGLEITYDGSAGGDIVVLTPSPGGPADRAGVVAGDVLVAVDGQPTKGLSLYDASDLLQGPPDSQVCSGTGPDSCVAHCAHSSAGTCTSGTGTRGGEGAGHRRVVDAALMWAPQVSSVKQVWRGRGRCGWAGGCRSANMIRGVGQHQQEQSLPLLWMRPFTVEKEALNCECCWQSCYCLLHWWRLWLREGGSQNAYRIHVPLLW
jgi:hypothetical protein